MAVDQEDLMKRLAAFAEANPGTPIGMACAEAYDEIDRLEFEFSRADRSAKRLGSKWKLLNQQLGSKDA